MTRNVILGAAVLLLAACAAFGPPAITLTRGDIAERAFVDRSEIDLKQVFGGVEGMDIRGPDVGFQLTAQRIELAWAARFGEGPLGIPLSIRLALSGIPVLNAQGNGIDLTEVRIEEVRMPSVPFINLDTKKFGAGEALGALPLLQFRPEELNREGIVYQATGVTLNSLGVHVALAPK